MGHQLLLATSRRRQMQQRHHRRKKKKRQQLDRPRALHRPSRLPLVVLVTRAAMWVEALAQVEVVRATKPRVDRVS